MASGMFWCLGIVLIPIPVERTIWVYVFLNNFMLLEILFILISVCRWPHQQVLHDEENKWNHWIMFAGIDKFKHLCIHHNAFWITYAKIRLGTRTCGEYQHWHNDTLEIESFRVVPREKLGFCGKRCGLLISIWDMQKNLAVHYNIHIDVHIEYMMVVFDNVEVCCTLWYIIHAMCSRFIIPLAPTWLDGVHAPLQPL